MKEVVDLYTKLVIGMFSFMGPSFTLLIPLFYRGIKSSEQKHSDILKNLIEVIHGLPPDSSFQEEVEKTSIKLNARVKKNKTDLNLLNPKRQVIRIFGSLLLSIIFIELYYFQNSHFWGYKSSLTRGLTLLFSILCLSYTIRVLWQVFCTIIKIKIENEAESEKKGNLTLSKV